MKVIKKGNPYKKHKCSRCKSVYIYHIYEDKTFNDLLYCPVCHNYLDIHIFDRKASIEEIKDISKPPKNKEKDKKETEAIEPLRVGSFGARGQKKLARKINEIIERKD